MKTKFILSGGYADHLNEENNKFFREILNTEKKELKILLVIFAKEREVWPELKEKMVSQFERNKEDKKLSYEIAEEDNFVNQCRETDIIYMHGGKTLKLLEFLRKFPDLKDYYQQRQPFYILGAILGRLWFLLLYEAHPFFLIFEIEKRY